MMNNAKVTVHPIQHRVLAINEERHVSPTTGQKQALSGNEYVPDTVKQCLTDVPDDDSSDIDSECGGNQSC